MILASAAPKNRNKNLGARFSVRKENERFVFGGKACETIYL
jgi:hypothetical protein